MIDLLPSPVPCRAPPLMARHRTLSCPKSTAQASSQLSILCAVIVISKISHRQVVIGGWRPPAGIVLVAGRLTKSLMLILSSEG